MTDDYLRMAEDNRSRAVRIAAERGVIYDRNGSIMVQNRASLMLVTGSDHRPSKKILASLARLLKIPLPDMEERLRREGKKPGFLPVVLAEDVPLSIATYIREHQSAYPGVVLETRAVRDYPYLRTAAHIVGYTGEVSDAELKQPRLQGRALGDEVGKNGIEFANEAYLSGVNGARWFEVDASGRLLGRLRTKEPVAGKNVVLTLDLRAQRAAEEALAQATVDAHHQKYPRAKSGAAIVLDVNTGEVIAAASLPTYDPAAFVGGLSTAEWKILNSKGSEYPLQNRAIMSSFAPGSTFKPFVALAALREGLATPRTTVLCTGRWTKFGTRWKKFCWKRSGHGRVSLVQALAVSCDSYFYELGWKLSRKAGERLQSWVRTFGFGDPTGVDIPSESRGRVPDTAWKRAWNERRNPSNKAWVPGDTVNMAIGQGDLLVSPLQLAVAYASLANGGTVYRPYVGKRVVDQDGTILVETRPKIVSQLVFPPAQLAAVRRGLERVVTEGTAKAAFAGFPMPVAGKTGTSQVFGKDDYSWFAAYAPADKPKHAVVVVVEQGGHGGSVAAPAARQILGRIAGYPPSVWRVEKVQDRSR